MKCNLFYVTGLLVAFGYDNLSRNKPATQSQTAVGDVYDASNAVDGNPASCMRAKLIGLNSPDKTVWWKVDLGGKYNIYSVNILFKNFDGYDIRQRGRFAGFSLFVSRTGDIQGAILCYKDKYQLPPLNFTCICTESGRYVIYYNERFDEITYPTGYEVTAVSTDLCEVTVQGCDNASVYGINCDKSCPTNCKDNTCHIQSGQCLNCKPGWTGMHCNTKCEEGWYGENCSQQCAGHCRDTATCNHVTGRCEEGCDAGWTGMLCNKSCDVGTYGYNCVNNCSSHCLNDFPCNKQTGQCDTGCKPGYTDTDCNNVCPSGHYGINCTGSCSGHCLNNEPCDHISGACSSGCQDGFVGLHCNNSCTKGYFGTKCSRECSPNCNPDICRHTDGLCTSCGAGWIGFNCTTACVQSYGENCQNSCSPNCYNKTCDRFNGRCLIGCQDGYYGEMCEEGREENKAIKQNMSNCIIFAIGFSISLLINLIFIGCGISLCRRRQPRSVTFYSNMLFCWKKSIYQDTVVKTEDASTYQELDLSDSVYQNTTIR